MADRGIERLRRRHRLNLMATLLLSQGTPMLLAGDEFGNGQRGNNNAYCQDNETGWLDWGGLDADPGFLDRVRELIRLRRAAPLLRQAAYAHGVEGPGIAWLHASGAPMSADQWRRARSFGLLLSDEDGARGPDVFILINGAHSARDFVLPPIPPGGAWRPAFSSAGPDGLEWRDGSCRLGPFSIACLTAAGGR